MHAVEVVQVEAVEEKEEFDPPENPLPTFGPRPNASKNTILEKT